ncbi:MAG: DnaJ domain-containing protein [Clostridia bacterium]|nr:DnaJ domain-containing protein [Clostridia bacterium]MBR0406493.1 DnaJ domain-containing protein [Clostridia bacterium]
MNAFEVLGLPRDATEEQVRHAYHTRVKACHPDQFIDGQEQQRAQEQLIQLNLAYEEALRHTAGAQRGAAMNVLSPEEAKKLALRLMAQQRYESALLQLSHVEQRDDEWYYIHGRLLMNMRQYSTAHQSFREAVRMRPENRDYRQGALDAAVAIKKHQKWRYRVADWAGNIFHRAHRRGLR